jgi:hypothetical protein
MKKSDACKKLTLSRETLRVLEPRSLEKAGGGTPTTIILITLLTYGSTPRRQA